MRFNGIAMSRVSIAVCSIILLQLIGGNPETTWMGNAQKNDQQNREPLHLTVVLERTYLDGELSQEVVHETCWSMEEFWAKYDQWQVTEMSDKQIVLRNKVDDISPLLKANGYFGMTNDGVLTIFNGKPGRSRIIQSFFQLDIKKLESKKQEELIQGIPIKSKDRYVEVLETFKSYSK